MNDSVSTLELAATVCFAFALLHTFLVKWLRHLGGKFPSGSVPENFFHLMGEIAVVFGVW